MFPKLRRAAKYYFHPFMWAAATTLTETTEVAQSLQWLAAETDRNFCQWKVAFSRR
jgi:hypothetical protein